MGQVFKNYWTTISKKPKGFKSIGRNIYEYEIKILVNKENPKVYGECDTFKETISIHYEYISEYGERKINMDEFNKSVKMITGLDILKDDIKIDEELFKRDGILVPFIEYINVPVYKSKIYQKHKIMKDRLLKMKQIKNKICQ